MPLLTRGRKVTRGSCCRDSWRADVTVMCSDAISLGQDDFLFVQIRWRQDQVDDEEAGQRPDDAQPTVLRFRRLDDSSGGDIRFDGPEGPSEKGFPADARSLLKIHGRSATSGEQPDMALDIVIDGDEQEPILLRVGGSRPDLSIQSAGGGPGEDVVLAQSRQAVEAVASPSGGRFRWISVLPSAMSVEGADTSASVELLAQQKSREIGDRPVCVLYSPQEGPSVMAVLQATVVEPRFLLGSEGDNQAPQVQGRGRSQVYRALLLPQGIASGQQWSVSQGPERLRINGDASGAAVEVEAFAAASQSAADSQLSVEFSTAGTPSALTADHPLTVVNLEILSPGQSPAPSFVNVGIPQQFQAAVEPEGLDVQVQWSAQPDPSSTARVRLEQVSEVPLGRAVRLTGLEGSTPPAQGDLQLQAGLASPPGSPQPAPSTLISHPLTVVAPLNLAQSGFAKLTLRWPDSEPGNAAFLGTPIPLPADRRPYLHPRRPANFQETVELAATPEALLLDSSGNPGEFEPPANLVMPAGIPHFLVIPEHIFVHAPISSAARPWQRRIRFRELEAANRVFGLPVVLDGNVLRFTPVEGEQQEWGTDRRDIYVVALLPHLSNTAPAQLEAGWQRSSRQMRTAIGEYPAFDEAALPFHKALQGANLADAQRQHRSPADFIRFLPAGQRSFTDLSSSLFLEAFLWDQQTLDGQAPPAAPRFLPLPKRTFLEGIEALRTRLGANTEFVVRSGFVPPDQFNAAFNLRAVGGQEGFRVNQIRHIFGDAADLDVQGDSFNQRANRIDAAEAILPWPDNAAAQAVRNRFSLMQFERLMVNTAPAAISRQYVLHVDRRDYDLTFHAGVYQIRMGDLTAANGHQNIHNNLAGANAGYADVVTVVPQTGAGVRPNAFYPTNLNANQPHGHAVFNGTNNNPNLNSLLGLMDNSNRFATLNIGPKDVGHDEDVQAIIQELFATFANHASFLGVSLDLEWFLESLPVATDATNVVEDAAQFIRANHPGRFLFVIWFGPTAARIDWTRLQPLSNEVVMVYDGNPNAWSAATRRQWGDFILNQSVLQRIWDSNRNLRHFGQNILLPGGIPAGDMTAAISWLGRMSRLYGCTSFAYQFNRYGQNWGARTANLAPVMMELGP